MQMKMHLPNTISLFNFIVFCILINILYGGLCFFAITIVSTLSGNHTWYQDQAMAWLTADKIALSGILMGLVAFVDMLMMESVDMVHWLYTKKISLELHTGHAIYRCALVIAVNTFMTGFIFYFISGVSR